MTNPTVAIATGILGKATETGARRHIGLLFGGRTVVLCERREPGADARRPTFVQSEVAADWAGAAERLVGNGVQSLRYACSGVPFGRRRRALAAFLRAHHVRAIVAEFGHIGANLGPIGEELGIPVFVYFRGFDASKRLRTPRVVRRYRAAVPRWAGIVAVSRSLIDNLAAVGVGHPNTAVIPTGVDTEVFRPAPEKDPNLIVAVGRIVAKKAPLVTVDAFGAVAADFPDHRLEIVGDGELRGAAEARARALGLESRVVFHGLKDHAFVLDRLSRATVFLQHSVTAADGNTEGLPTAIQEAMACGDVVVSTRHAGIPEVIVSGENGMLVDEGDGPGFAAALRRVLADRVLGAGIAAAARETAVERFEYRRLHARLEAMIAAAAPALSAEHAGQ